MAKISMIRPDIENLIDEALVYFKARSISLLPPNATWDVRQWTDFFQRNPDRLDYFSENGIGWDVSDFGLGDFEKYGGVFYTVHNNTYSSLPSGFRMAEKWILRNEGQGAPAHYHKIKSEYTTNFGPGNLEVTIGGIFLDGTIDSTSMVSVEVDHLSDNYTPGDKILLKLGSYIFLPAGTIHSFKVYEDRSIVHEVSSANDDRMRMETIIF